MKNIDLIRLKNGFTACAGLKGVKFAYAVAKNTRLVDVVLADLRKAIEPDDGYKEFDKARLALCNEHAVKDKHGKAKMDQRGAQFILHDPSMFADAFADMMESDAHKAAVERHEEKLTEYRNLLEEGEADYEPHTIALSDVPDDITPSQFEAIYEIVQEDD